VLRAPVLSLFRVPLRDCDEQSHILRGLVSTPPARARGAPSPHDARRVRRGVAAQRPAKYVLDDQELARVSKLARIELEDARTELLRAQEAAATMGRGAELDEADDDDGAGDGDGDEAGAGADGDEDAWVE
jgi:hypothetical protein